jgi:hypothetical protein
MELIESFRYCLKMKEIMTPKNTLSYTDFKSFYIAFTFLPTRYRNSIDRHKIKRAEARIMNWPRFLRKELSSKPSILLLRISLFIIKACESNRLIALSTHCLGMILIEDIDMIILRQKLRFSGRLTLSRVMCVMICNVFSRLHMRFMEAPKANAINIFAMMPVTREESRTEKALLKFFIRAT